RRRLDSAADREPGQGGKSPFLFELRQDFFPALGFYFIGKAARSKFTAVQAGINLGYLGAEKDNQCRVIDPEQQSDERARGTVDRGYRTMAQVIPDQALSKGKKDGRDQGSHPHVTPCDANIREIAKQQGKQQSNDDQGRNRVNVIPDRASAGELQAQVSRDGGDNR